MKLSLDGPFDNLEILADTLSELLNCPVTVEDANHRLLAYSTHKNQKDPVRLATIMNRRVPEHIINHLWKTGVMKKLHQSEEPIRIAPNPEVDLGGRIAVSVRKNHEVIGYIWVIEEINPIDEFGMELLKRAAQAVKAKLLQLHTQNNPHIPSIQEFIWQLLTGHFQSHTEILERAKTLQVVPSGCLQVIVFDFGNEISLRMLQNIQNVISSTFSQKRMIGFVVDGHQLILLAQSPNQVIANREMTLFMLDFKERMKTLFEMIFIVCGAGGHVTEDYTKIDVSYKEALMVLQIKNQFQEDTKFLYHFKEMGFYRYLNSIKKEEFQRNGSHPAIEKLVKYDTDHQSDLLKTLEVFLTCDSNIKEASEKLNVHANTLSYRISRISEIAQINLKDMNQKVTLYIDLKLRKLP